MARKSKTAQAETVTGEYVDSNALATVPADEFVLATLAPIFDMWAESSTGQGARHGEIVKAKAGIVSAFFDLTQKQPHDVTPQDVADWRAELVRQGLTDSTIYGKVSRLSAFFKWLSKGEFNPAAHARPAAPKPYTSEKTKALTAEQVKRLLLAVNTEAGKSLSGRRDYAMLLLYLLTGMRRSEVVRLRWGDITLIGDRMTIRYTIKGGKTRNRELNNRAAVKAIRDYLKAARRLDTMTDDSPLWVSHDFNRAGQSHAGPGHVAVARTEGKPITSHGFVKNLKRYARIAGIPGFHLHMTRHTVANSVDDLNAAQDILDHASQNTTRIYRQAIGTKQDKYSDKLAGLFGIDATDDQPAPAGQLTIEGE